jgi:steroid delta-isomerase-like uncharacterized protein
MSSNLNNNKAIVRRFHELFDKGNMQDLEQLVAPNCCSYQSGVPQPLDREAFKQMGLMFIAAFSNSQTVIQDQIAEGDMVATRGTWNAVHTGDFQGIPATHQQVSISIMVIDRIENNLIVEHWANFDAMTLMQQLGVMNSPA